MCGGRAVTRVPHRASFLPRPPERQCIAALRAGLAPRARVRVCDAFVRRAGRCARQCGLVRRNGVVFRDRGPAGAGDCADSQQWLLLGAARWLIGPVRLSGARDCRVALLPSGAHRVTCFRAVETSSVVSDVVTLPAFPVITVFVEPLFHRARPQARELLSAPASPVDPCSSLHGAILWPLPLPTRFRRC